MFTYIWLNQLSNTTNLWWIDVLLHSYQLHVSALYMGVCYANLSFVEFRAMILRIHVYVYIGYMDIDTQ